MKDFNRSALGHQKACNLAEDKSQIVIDADDDGENVSDIQLYDIGSGPNSGYTSVLPFPPRSPLPLFSLPAGPSHG